MSVYLIGMTCALKLCRLANIHHRFAYSSFLALQISRAASNLNFYVDVDQGGWTAAKISLFYVTAFAIIVMINCANVKVCSESM